LGLKAGAAPYIDGTVKPTLVRPARAEPVQKSSMIFMDETGTIVSDRIFAVGILKCPMPAAVQRPFTTMRDARHFYDELKWNKLNRKGLLETYQEAVDAFFHCGEATFACFVADREKNDPVARFGDQWKAYERLAAQLIVGNVAPQEYVSILADEYSTPANVTFEEDLQKHVEDVLRRRVVIGICRMRSTGVDLFQVLDLLLGAVAYEYRLKTGLVPASTKSPKRDLLAHVLGGFGVNSFLGGTRGPRLNVAEYGNAKGVQGA
jgi:hypothetical protein